MFRVNPRALPLLLLAALGIETAAVGRAIDNTPVAAAVLLIVTIVTGAVLSLAAKRHRE